MKKIGDFLFVEQCFAEITCKNPENFFTEFENLISDEEEW